ncbi:PaaX family transcriptional regulator C-terminal domain-containing protein [Spirillospora sp. NPDC050365]
MAEDVSIPTRTLILGCVRRDGYLDAAELYGVAEACGMTEMQVRLCLRRLVSEGALEQVGGRGRRAEFVTRGDSASQILPELEYLHFAYRQDAGLEPWDGRWRLVGFSVSEDRRAARDDFRDRLLYFGAAPVHGGLYVSPHALGEVVVTEAERLGIAETLAMMESDRLSLGGVTDPRELAGILWPLASVARGYEDFLGRLERRLGRAKVDVEGSGPDVGAGDVFATTLEFARAIEPDPLLPPELLPERWSGVRARRRLADARGMLAGLELGDRFPTLFDWLAAIDGGSVDGGAAVTAGASGSRG